MAAQVIPLIERCPRCGREWPSRFGDHNCNYQMRPVHNNSIIVEPGAPLHQSIERLADRLEREAKVSAQYAELAGEECPYHYTLAQIDATIGFLKRYRRDIQSLARHTHQWSEDDYCEICGADGRV